MSASQASLILRDLRRGRRITPIDALKLYACFRLGARIFDLKKRGHPIQSERIEVKPGVRVARYSMRRGTQ